MEGLCQETLERYLALRSAELLPTTIRHYRLSVSSLIEFLHQSYPEVDTFAKLQRDPHIVGWLKILGAAQPPYTNDTRRQLIIYVRRFLRDIRAWRWPQSPPPDLLFRRDLPPSPRNKNSPSRQHTALPDSPLYGSLKRYLEIRGTTLRPGSLRCYRTDLLSLIRFIQRAFPELSSFSKLERHPHIEGWLQELARAQPPYKNKTRQKRIQNVSRFLEDIRDWGWPETPPPGVIQREDLPPSQHYLPKPLPFDVDAALMKELKRSGDPISLGLILARRTGLRVGELCRLEMDCLMENRDGHYSLRVPLGKLRSERLMPLDRETADLINALREMRGERAPTLDPETGRAVDLIFRSRDNDILNRGTFQLKLKAVAKSLGITENVYPHRLRHTYATELLRYGVSLPGVMKLLGHSSPRMTLRYVEVTNADLSREYLQAIERAQKQYAQLKHALSDKPHDDQDPREVIPAAFDGLIARIQAIRFEHQDPACRKKLQRLVERLRMLKRKLKKILA